MATEYHVKVPFEAVDNVSASLFSIMRNAESTRKVAERFHGSMEKGLGRIKEIAISLGVVFGVKELIGQFVKLNEETQRTRLSIAGSVMAMVDLRRAGLPSGFIESQKVAGVLLEKLRTDARAAGVASGEYVGAWRDFLPVAQRVGLTVGESLKTVRLLAPAAKAMQIPLSEITGSLELMAAGGRVARPVREFFLQLGLDSEKLRGKLMQGPSGLREVMKELEKGLERNRVVGRAYSDSFEASLVRIRENVKDFFEAAGKPIFEAVTRSAGRLGIILEGNRESIQRAGKAVGEWIGVQIEKVVGILKNMREWWEKNREAIAEIGKHMDQIVTAVKTIAIIWLTIKAGKILGELTQIPARISEASKALGMFGSAAETEGGKAAETIVDQVYGTAPKLEAAAGVAGGAINKGILSKIALIGPQIISVITAAITGFEIGKVIGDWLGKAMQEKDFSAYMKMRERTPGERGLLGRAFMRFEEFAMGGKPVEVMAGGRVLDPSQVAAMQRSLTGIRPESRMTPELWDAMKRPVPEGVGVDVGKLALKKAPEMNQNFYGPINIEQQFREADPERVIARFQEDLAALGENPAMSPHALATGM